MESTYLDAPGAAAGECAVPGTGDVAVRVRGVLQGVVEPRAAVALVPELDARVAEALRGAGLDARRGGVVRGLRRDVARDDALRVVDGAARERRPAERDRRRREGVGEAGEGEHSHEGDEGMGEGEAGHGSPRLMLFGTSRWDGDRLVRW